jgi:hypothetical protein
MRGSGVGDGVRVGKGVRVTVGLGEGVRVGFWVGMTLPQADNNRPRQTIRKAESG